jgi:hypothetical protein
MSDTTLDVMTLGPKEEQTTRETTGAEGSSYAAGEQGAQTSDSVGAMNIRAEIDELANYSEEARDRIKRGLRQTETRNLGSFSEYVE